MRYRPTPTTCWDTTNNLILKYERHPLSWHAPNLGRLSNPKITLQIRSLVMYEYLFRNSLINKYKGKGSKKFSG